MSDSKWICEEIAKGREEAYFRQKEAELIAALRQRGQQLRDRERLAEAVGVHDEKILSSFEELGFFPRHCDDPSSGAARPGRVERRPRLRGREDKDP